MNQFPSIVKEKFNSILSEMSDRHWMFVNDPGHDFTRQHTGKLSFEDTLRFIIGMGKGTTSDEIIDYFDMDPDRIPSVSAFTQRRKQLNLYAFRYLFEEFTYSFPNITHSFKDHCILAADGSHVVYCTNKEIIEDYNKPRMIDHRGHNHMHLNGFVDVINKTFLDFIIQPGQKPDEREAFHLMLDHFEPEDPSKYIITLDRGYESYDAVFHCELKRFKYVFRIKEPASHSILSTFSAQLPDDKEEFDVRVKRFFTDKKTKVIKEQDQVYHYMNPNMNIPHFYQLLNGGHIYYLTFRVVKIKTSENTYEYLITNLPASFDIDDIRECYHWRWGIEIVFRYLKHATGLLHFHCKKPEFLKQEIYASIILYNMGIFITNEAIKDNRKKKRKPENKYIYDVDISSGIKIVRKFLIRQSSKQPPDIIKLILRFVHAVKEKYRKFPRYMRGISAIRFNYR